jgi:hypothetical protein
MCIHETIQLSQDGERVIVCGDCGREFVKVAEDADESLIVPAGARQGRGAPRRRPDGRPGLRHHEQRRRPDAAADLPVPQVRLVDVMPEGRGRAVPHLSLRARRPHLPGAPASCAALLLPQPWHAPACPPPPTSSSSCPPSRRDRRTVSDFARLVKIVWADLDERQGALERLFSKGKEPRLELTVTPGHISLGISTGRRRLHPRRRDAYGATGVRR